VPSSVQVSKVIKESEKLETDPHDLNNASVTSRKLIKKSDLAPIDHKIRMNFTNQTIKTLSKNINMNSEVYLGNSYYDEKKKYKLEDII
jgi:hypothetical protein